MNPHPPHTPHATMAMTPTDCGLPKAVWLASKSPRRLELLRTLGLQARVYLAQTGAAAEHLEEPQAAEAPLPYVARVTALKLQTAQEALACALQTGQETSLGPHNLIVASDTTVALNGNILGKPANEAEALGMLRALSGAVHQVHTGVAVACLESGWTAQVIHTSEVEFAALPEAFIEAYVRSGEPFDKAGGYGIQGIAGQYIARISGSHSGIMGLPLFETATLLRQALANQQ